MTDCRDPVLNGGADIEHGGDTGDAGASNGISDLPLLRHHGTGTGGQVPVSRAPYRGQGLGRRLMEHVIGYAKTELHDVAIQLTSRPHRVAANELYQQMGFQKKDTNVYVMKA